MKLIHAIILALAATSSILAQSPYERERVLLKEQRDKSTATALEPINRRYKAAVEQLVSRATQAKDLEAAEWQTGKNDAYPVSALKVIK